MLVVMDDSISTHKNAAHLSPDDFNVDPIQLTYVTFNHRTTPSQAGWQPSQLVFLEREDFQLLQVPHFVAKHTLLRVMRGGQQK